MNVIAFTKAKLPYGWMGNMTRYPIKFGDIIYPSAEALFQALRFSDNEIREIIRSEKNPMSAKERAKENAKSMTVKPLSEKDVSNMRLCISLKVSQHPNLINELLDTGDATIIEDVTKRGNVGSNLFWGAMLVNDEWIGENILGKIWMDLRKQLKNKSC